MFLCGFPFFSHYFAQFLFRFCSTSERRAEHPFAFRNTQQPVTSKTEIKLSNYVYLNNLFTMISKMILIFGEYWLGTPALAQEVKVNCFPNEYVCDDLHKKIMAAGCCDRHKHKSAVACFVSPIQPSNSISPLTITVIPQLLTLI